LYRYAVEPAARRAVLRAATAVQCDSPGDVILREGAPRDALYIVIGGAVAAHSRERRGDAGGSGRRRGGGGNAGGDSLLAPLLLDEAMEAAEEEIVGDPESAQRSDEERFGPRVDAIGGGGAAGGDGGGGGGGAPEGWLLRTGLWFGFDTADIDGGGGEAATSVGPSVGGIEAMCEAHSLSPATYVAASADGCALLTVSREALAACVVGEAVSSSLQSFFGGAVSDSDEPNDYDGDHAWSDDDEYDETPSGAHIFAASPGDGGGGVQGVASAEAAAAATKAAERLTPQASLVAAGAANAVLHCAMGSHPLDTAVQLAGLRAIRLLASPPCGEATRKELGALGALDRVAVAASVAGADVGAGGGGGTGGGGGGRESEEAAAREAVTREAKRAMQALVDGCEQNMRHALSLGCGDMVW
jgi:hypothetical protein